MGPGGNRARCRKRVLAGFWVWCCCCEGERIGSCVRVGKGLVSVGEDETDGMGGKGFEASMYACAVMLLM